VPTKIYLPHNTPQIKIDKLARWGAEVTLEGTVWDEANHAALEHAAREGLTYIHPFADPAVITGQATVGLEIIEELPEVETLVVAIGGGGLISGISLAAKAINPNVRIIGVEAVGAPTLYESLKADKIVELGEITTVVGTLAARRTEPINFDIIHEHVDHIVLISDDEMREAARWLWFEMGLAAEMSGAAGVAAIMTGKIESDGVVCALVCGAGTDGIA
jgi:threonine dehydratase